MNEKTASAPVAQPAKLRKGFAVMDPKRMREIAAQGGRTAHSSGRAHKWNSEEAIAAGKKSAAVRAAKRAMAEDKGYA